MSWLRRRHLWLPRARGTGLEIGLKQPRTRITRALRLVRSSVRSDLPETYPCQRPILPGGPRLSSATCARADSTLGLPRHCDKRRHSKHPAAYTGHTPFTIRSRDSSHCSTRRMVSASQPCCCASDQILSVTTSKSLAIAADTAPTTWQPKVTCSYPQYSMLASRHSVS